MRYIEYQVVIGDAPSEIIAKDIKELTLSTSMEDNGITTEEELKIDPLWNEGVIHHLSKETYFWNFSLVYKKGNFDIIKWKTANAWKSQKSGDIIIDKPMFIGVDAGVFFISIDENIDDNFTKLADLMDIFIEKTKKTSPFLVYGVIENKQKIAELKTNKELLKNLADVKKWTLQNGGVFRLENLKELKMNLVHLISDYAHFILTKLKTKTNYTALKLGEVHFLDYEDLTTLKEIEESLAEQTKAGETVDDLLSELFFKYFKMPEFQEEVFIPLPEPEAEPEEVPKIEETKPSPSKIKMILREIRLGIRRQCPKCFNNERTKIREVIDRNHIIMENPNIYGFKFICGICGNEWKTQKDWEIIEE